MNIKTKHEKKHKPFEASIIPSKSITLKSVSISVAIMAFLACIATGMLFIIYKTASLWAADISSEITLQIRPVEGQIHQEQVNLAVQILNNTEGVSSVKVLDRAENEDLLAPWLGRGVDYSLLPIPTMIIIEVDALSPPDFTKLNNDISRQIVGASLDTHRLWLNELKSMANTLIVTGVIVLALILAATALTIIFATRAAVASSREVVTVLDMVGAKEFYIANQFEKHFLKIGVVGGAIGGIFALLIFWVAGAFSLFMPQSSVNAQLKLLFGGFKLPFEGYIGIFVVLVFVIFLTTLTSRLAVLRFLRDIKIR